MMFSLLSGQQSANVALIVTKLKLMVKQYKKLT